MSNVLYIIKKHKREGAIRDYEEKSVNKIFYDNNRRKACVKSVFHLALYIAVTKLHVKSGREIRPFF